MANDLTFVLKARNEASRAARQFVDTMRKAGTSTRDVANEARRAATETRRVGREARQAAQGTDQIGRGLRSANIEAKLLQATFGRLKATIAGFVGGTLLAFSFGAIITDAIQTAKGFEAVLSEVKAFGQLTENQMKAVEAQARDLGAATSFSAKEAGEGLLELVKAGFTVTQALEAIPTALDLAKAGALGLGEAAETAVKILGSTRKSVQDFAHVSDVLSLSAAVSTIGIQDLGASFRFFGPVVGQFGIEIEEASAAIAILGNSGIQGALAGSSLRAVFARLINPTKQARDVLDRIGISVNDLNPELVSMTEIFRTLSGAQLSARDAAIIFGTEAQGTVQILRNAFPEFEKLTKTLKDSDGVLRATALVMGDNLEGAVKELRSAIEELYISLVNNGALTRFVQFLTAIVRALTPAREGFRGLKEETADLSKFLEDLRVRAAELEDRFKRYAALAREVIDAVKDLTIAFALLYGVKGAALLITSLTQIRALVWTTTAAIGVAGGGGLLGALTRLGAILRFAWLVATRHPIILLISLAIGKALQLSGILDGILGQSSGLGDAVQERTASVVNREIKALEEARAGLKADRERAARENPAGLMGLPNLAAADTDSILAVKIDTAAEKLKRLRNELEGLTSDTSFDGPTAPLKKNSGVVVERPDVTPADYDTAAGSGSGAAKRNAFLETVTAIRDRFKEQAETIRLTVRELEEYQIRAELLRAAQEDGIVVSEATIQAVVDYRNEMRRIIDDGIISEITEDMVEGFREQAETIAMTTGELENYRIKQELVRQAEARGAVISDEQVAAVIRLKDQLKAAGLEAQTFGAGVRLAFDDFRNSLQTNMEFAREFTKGVFDDFTGMVTDFVTTGKLSWKEFLGSIIAQLSAFFANRLVMDFFGDNGDFSGGGSSKGTMSFLKSAGSFVGSLFGGSLFGGGGGKIGTPGITAGLFGGGRAGGGPVRRNSLYTVGEEGPEFFVPDQNGAILPSRETLSMIRAIARNPGAARIAGSSFTGGVSGGAGASMALAGFGGSAGPAMAAAGGSGPRVTNIAFNITTPDVQGFRRSETQLRARMKSAMDRDDLRNN